MCGLAGIVLRQPGPLGERLVAMATAIRHRGFDSTGFALYGPPAEAHAIDVHVEGPARAAVEALLAELPDVTSVEQGVRGAHDAFLRVTLAPGVPPAAIAAAIEEAGGDVHGAGRALRVVKDLGDAPAVAARHGVSTRSGAHGTVHCRLATESRVDVGHSHPFWAAPFPDVTVVHHGHVTNYDRLRRTMIGQGHRFRTGNDSELCAVWLAARMADGASLEEALAEASGTFDGTYLLLVGTADGVGAVRDRYGACPLVIAEDAEAIAFGSELRAVLAVVDDDAEVRNLAEEGVVAWSTATTLAS
jgi:glutamine phosphoribosylpyrophosphate amidotransferase